MQSKEQRFKYLSQERVEEVHQIFEHINGQNWNFVFSHQYDPAPDFYDINKPFEQFSILKYHGLEFKLESTSKIFND